MFPILSIILNPLGKISFKYYISGKFTILIVVIHVVVVANADVYSFVLL